MKCMRCGREMINTIGGNFNCPTCGMSINDLVDRSQDYNTPASKDLTKQEGWICPVCGRGIAPWMDVCPCQNDIGLTNVTTTGETVDLSEYYTLINDKTVPEAKFTDYTIQDYKL